jgi:hypothetical protein
LGYLGIVILFGLWGFLQSLLYKGFYLPRKNNFIAQIIYIILILGLIGFGDWILIFISSIIPKIIFLLPLVLVLRSKNFKSNL